MGRFTLADCHIVDGTGQDQFTGYVTVLDDRIEHVGATPPPITGTLIEADGLIVAPGFIDMHSHSDLTLFADGRAVSKISQGITLEIIGQCGISGAPLYGHMEGEVGKFFEKHRLTRPYSTMKEYLEAIDTHIAVNILALIGHGTLRRGVMGEGDAPATPQEITAMQEAVDAGMRAGALGLSTGLIYPPGCYTPTEEVIALTRPIAPHHGLYFSHLRNEGDTLIEAVDEALRIGRESAVGVQLSHHKAMGPHNWGKTRITLEHIDQAIANGQDVYMDQYPYVASATSLTALLPDWALIGGAENSLERFKDEALLQRIMNETEAKESRFGWDRTRIGTVREGQDRALQGKSMAEIAKQWDMPPVRALIKILQDNAMQVSMIRFGMGEEDVERVFRHPRTLIGTDGGGSAPDGPLSQGNPHPRTYGTFPRVLGKFVREKHWVSLEEAIHRMTGLAAHRLGLIRRGRIAPGYVADLVVLDPNRVADTATFANPHQTAEGIYYVYVNGTLVWQDNHHTGRFPGRALRYYAER